MQGSYDIEEIVSWHRLESLDQVFTLNVLLDTSVHVIIGVTYKVSVEISSKINVYLCKVVWSVGPR